MPKMLIVEDDDSIRLLIKLILQDSYKRFKVTAVKNNQEALHYLDSNLPDIILTDIVRPGGDGYEFIAGIRGSKRTRMIPVIVISMTSIDMHEELKQWRLGFNAILPKPFQRIDLIRTINRLLDFYADPDVCLLLAGSERQDLDYKEMLLFTNKDCRAAFAKDVIAMANWGGGTVIVGVAESVPGAFSWKGVPDELLPDFETTRVNKAIKDFVDPHIHIESKVIKYEGRNYIMLTVPPARNMVFLARKQNDKVQLFQGRIYTRNSSAESAEVQTSAELREVLGKIQS